MNQTLPKRNLILDDWLILDADLGDTPEAVLFNTESWFEWNCPDHRDNLDRHPECIRCESNERIPEILERAHRECGAV